MAYEVLLDLAPVYSLISFPVSVALTHYKYATYNDVLAEQLLS